MFTDARYSTCFVWTHNNLWDKNYYFHFTDKEPRHRKFQEHVRSHKASSGRQNFNSRQSDSSIHLLKSSPWRTINNENMCSGGIKHSRWARESWRKGKMTFEQRPEINRRTWPQGQTILIWEGHKWKASEVELCLPRTRVCLISNWIETNWAALT